MNQRTRHLLMMKMKPDLVQIPYNILNQEFEPYLEKLKSLNTEIHVRSIFLQGLLFKPLFKIPLQLYSLKPALEKLTNFVKFRINKTGTFIRIRS